MWKKVLNKIKSQVNPVYYSDHDAIIGKIISKKKTKDVK